MYGEQRVSAKEYLSRVQHLDRRITARIETRDRYKELACGAAPDMSATKLSGTGNSSRVEDYVCKLIDLERELDSEIDRLVDARREAAEQIDQIKDLRQQTILILRYLEGLTWEKIAEAMNYDVKWVFKLHSFALAAIQKLLDDKEAMKSDG